MLGKLRELLGNRFSVEALKKYAKNTGWMAGEKVIRLVTVLFVGVWVGRYLGEENWGIVSYVLSSAGLFMTLPTLGSKDILVRDLVKAGSEESARLLGSGFLIHLLGGSAALFCSILFVLISGDSAPKSFFIPFAAGLTVFQSFFVIEYYFQAKTQGKLIAIAQTSSVLTAAGIKVFLILTEAGLIEFLYVYTAETAVPALFLTLVYWKNGESFLAWRADWESVKIILNQSKSYIISGLIVAFYMRSDQIMIVNMLNDAENGLYAVAAKLSMAWYLIPVVICGSLSPAVVYAKQNGPEEYRRKMQYLMNLLVWISLPVAAGVAFFSGEIIELLYAGKFSASAGVLAWHIWGGIFAFIGTGSALWLVQERLYKIAMYRTLAGGILNILLNLWWIPIYGITGAAVATLLSQVLAAYISHLIFPAARPMFRMQSRAFLLPFILLFEAVKKQK